MPFTENRADVISNSLKAKAMRYRMEDKNLLKHKGSFYVGKSSTPEIEGEDYSYITQELIGPNGVTDNGKVLVADSTTEQGWKIDQIGTEGIKDNAITTVKIADSNITTDKINNSAVTEAKINNSAVTEAKIDNSAVTAGKIGTGAVIASKIGTGAVTEVKIENLAVTASKIGTGAVIASKIGTGAVTEAKIENLAVTASKIGSGAVTTDKIASGSGIEKKVLIFNTPILCTGYPEGTALNLISEINVNNDILEVHWRMPGSSHFIDSIIIDRCQLNPNAIYPFYLSALKKDSIHMYMMCGELFYSTSTKLYATAARGKSFTGETVVSGWIAANIEIMKIYKIITL